MIDVPTHMQMDQPLGRQQTTIIIIKCNSINRFDLWWNFWRAKKSCRRKRKCWKIRNEKWPNVGQKATKNIKRIWWGQFRYVSLIKSRYVESDLFQLFPRHNITQNTYYDDLSRSASIENLKPVMTKLHNDSSERFLDDLTNFRRDVYRIIDDETFIKIKG